MTRKRRRPPSDPPDPLPPVTGRPRRCPNCRGQLEQLLDERWDPDANIWTGGVICRSCGQRRIYFAKTRARRQAPATGAGSQPWQLAAEDELGKRPGVQFIHLLTDEVGCQWLLRGEIPQYLLEQARRALDWSATDARQGRS